MKAKIMTIMLAVVFTACEVKEVIIDTPKDAEPIALKANLQKRVAQDNDFSFELLRQTIASSKDDNVTVSPLSVSMALGMTMNGARGETKSQMEAALYLSGLSTDEINEYYKTLITNLPKVDPLTKLSIANSIWYRDNFAVKSDFLKTNVDYFNAYVKALDFNKTWAKDTINNWVNKNTKGLIPSIVDQINSDAVMYLVNAVYFKGVWRLKFDKKLTHEANFKNAKAVNKKVNFMKQENSFGYFADENAQYIDLEYGNKAFSMTFILPNEGKTTSDILQNLNAEKFASVTEKLYNKSLILYLPRFKTESKFELNAPLKTMGMPLAFTEMADFGNIADARLFISKVMHKTYLAVDEEGTEAAAVTSVEMVLTSMPIIPEVRFDKPFVFVLREKSTGVVLFTGVIGDVEKY